MTDINPPHIPAALEPQLHDTSALDPYWRMVGEIYQQILCASQRLADLLDPNEELDEMDFEEHLDEYKCPHCGYEHLEVMGNCRVKYSHGEWNIIEGISGSEPDEDSPLYCPSCGSSMDWGQVQVINPLPELEVETADAIRSIRLGLADVMRSAAVLRNVLGDLSNYDTKRKAAQREDPESSSDALSASQDDDPTLGGILPLLDPRYGAQTAPQSLSQHADPLTVITNAAQFLSDEEREQAARILGITPTGDGMPE